MLELVELAVAGRLAPITTRLTQPALVALLGANGSGKSSLLLALANLLPASGAVYLQGQPLLQMEMSVAAQWRAMLPQRQPYLMPMACHHVLQLGQSMLCSPAECLQHAMQEVVTRLELEPLLVRDFSQLSGGEQQRVLLGKTLLQVWPTCNPQARLLLLDEPLAGLDWHHQVALLELLKQLVSQGILVLFSVHDFNLALEWADELLCLRQGTLHAHGQPTLLNEALLEELYRVRAIRLEQDGRCFFLPSGNGPSQG